MLTTALLKCSVLKQHSSALKSACKLYKESSSIATPAHLCKRTYFKSSNSFQGYSICYLSSQHVKRKVRISSCGFWLSYESYYINSKTRSVHSVFIFNFSQKMKSFRSLYLLGLCKKVAQRFPVL